VRPKATAEITGLSALTIKALASLPTRWFDEHVGTMARGCACTAGGPDQTCDVGEALWRLRPGARKHVEARP